MLYTGLFKRIIPFVVTFAVGLFVASFFVTLALPSFSGGRDGRRRGRHCHEKEQIRNEMDQLRDRVRSLRKENEELRRSTIDADTFLEDAVPPVVIEAPHPPKRPKKPRIETLQ